MTCLNQPVVTQVGLIQAWHLEITQSKPNTFDWVQTSFLPQSAQPNHHPLEKPLFYQFLVSKTSNAKMRNVSNSLFFTFVDIFFLIWNISHILYYFK